jgi:hypothetical protein
MHKLNPLQRNVLITNDEVIYHAPTDHTLDPRTIQQAIIIAEERFIRNAIGYDLYEQLILQKNTIVTTGNLAAQQALIDASLPEGSDAVVLKAGDVVNARETLSVANQALWNQHLWKLTAEAVLLTAFPDGFIHFGSSGVVHNQPGTTAMSGGGVVTPDLKSVKWMIDKKMMDRIDPLTEAMHGWLCRNKTVYTLYTKPCDCDFNGVAYKRKTDLIMGLYDEDPGPCGCPDVTNPSYPW